MGPGRYKEITAVKSSMDFGPSPTSTLRMPADSNWNTPCACPFASISKTAGSSSGTFEISKSGIRLRTSFSQSFIAVRLRRPRKSILSKPNSSRVVIVNCVTTESSGFATGTNSVIGCGAITTPAAWTEEWRGIPSTLSAVSISSVTLGSES